jgi:gamma-glutamyltranspeptidase/glutathione hydrolase
VGSIFRQPQLARTLRALVAEERRHRSEGREAAIYAARDRFYRGDIGARIAQAVEEAGGLMTAADLAGYRGRIETPARGVFRSRHGSFEVFKTGFWGQGPVLIQALSILQGFDLERMGHNSTEYIHTVTEALKLALADRDSHYGDPEFSRIPATGLLSEAYAAERRKQINPARAQHLQRPGDPWRFEPQATTADRALSLARRTQAQGVSHDPGAIAEPLDTTCINVADAEGNLFSASPSSAWFFGGVFMAGDTGVPLGNRMQAFVLDDGSANVVAGGKRPRTTLSPTVVLRDGKPYLAISTPGGDSQDQQILQVLLNIAVFGMSAQEAIEAPRFNSLHHERSFGDHQFRSRVLQVEDRVSPGVVEALRDLGHRIELVGPFMMNTGVTLAGIDPRYGTLFGAADPRRQRFVLGW